MHENWKLNTELESYIHKSHKNNSKLQNQTYFNTMRREEEKTRRMPTKTYIYVCMYNLLLEPPKSGCFFHFIRFPSSIIIIVIDIDIIVYDHLRTEPSCYALAQFLYCSGAITSWCARTPYTIIASYDRTNTMLSPVIPMYTLDTHIYACNVCICRKIEIGNVEYSMKCSNICNMWASCKGC